MFEINNTHCNSCGNQNFCAVFPVKVWGPPKPVETRFAICCRCMLDAVRHLMQKVGLIL